MEFDELFLKPFIGVDLGHSTTCDKLTHWVLWMKVL
jgi:hypothetical protein